jgi:TupA-like ATPgrasp
VHRVVDRNGTDFDTYRGKPTDPTIPLPGALADLFDVAERVSIVIRAPFSRIDLYDIRGRIVFGEVTPCPGPGGVFGPDLDITMGEAWERAQVRLWRDLAAGASREAEWGAPAGEKTALPRVDVRAPAGGHTPRPAHQEAPTEALRLARL